MSVRILQGDCLDVLATLPDESVQCVVTSPPYWGLRDYGVPGQLGLEATPEEHCQTMVKVFREVRRVLRTDGTLWLNYGDCYYSQGTRKHGGWNGSSYDGGDNPQKNVGQSAGDFAPHEVLKTKDLIGMPWRVALALQADGWYLRSDIIWHKPNPMPESVTDRPTKSHEYVFLLTKAARYFYDADAVREDFDPASLRTERKTSGQNKRNHLGDLARTTPVGRTCGVHENGRNLRDVWTIPTHAMPEAHFATFPPALVEPCIKAGCPKGGAVLDPFGGAGTVGLVADRLGRDAVLIELNPEYVEMARRRIYNDCPMFTTVEAV